MRGDRHPQPREHPCAPAPAVPRRAPRARAANCAPRYGRSIRAGDVTAHEVDLPEDNVFFGVRAAGGTGPRSPVAFPDPA